MTNSFLPTLSYPFANGTLEPPVDGDVLFLNAIAGLNRTLFPHVKAVQGFRPDFLALEREGHSVSPKLEGNDYAAALILCGRHRRRNEANIADALSRVRAGGLILVAGGKTDGIASLRKRVGALLPIEGHASKYHGVVFWLRCPANATTMIADLAPAGDKLVEGRFHTGAGVFSADSIDPGSRLLADNLPANLAGRGADFAAGWGYLSIRASERDSVTSIDLFEADHAALDAARMNLASGPKPATFHWWDLLSEPVERRYDFVLLNPPFHVGRAADPTLGQSMIAAASKALKPGGSLYLVANRGLPYEEILQKTFRQSGETLRDQWFKLLWARR